MLKDIVGYEGLYQVSNTGQVYRLAGFVNSKNGSGPFILPIKGGIMKQGDSQKGYKVVSLCRENKGREFKVHRLVATAFIPNPLNLKEVNHKDGDKTNNNDWNLEWSTHADNIKHAYATGLAVSRKTADHHMAKLDEISVQVIREALIAGHRQIPIAKYFNISQPHVSTIKRHAAWK